MTPPDLTPEQVIRDCLSNQGSMFPTTDANAILIRLRAAGIPVGWQDVRERLTADGPVNAASVARGDECECDIGGMGGCGGTHTDCYYRSILSVAISHAEEAR